MDGRGRIARPAPAAKCLQQTRANCFDLVLDRPVRWAYGCSMLPRWLTACLCAAGIALHGQVTAAAPSFVNFETAPVHPVDLSPDGRTLAVCNLPDYRVEFFDISTGVAQPIGDVPVGIDPVSVRWRTTNELWVVNHISSSLSVVDVARRRVAATIQTKAGPADVVFAGVPVRAFVSCAKEDTVQIIHPATHVVVTNLAIDGDRPKALAVSRDGSKVYAAIFESGNRSTILSPDPPGIFLVPGPVGSTNALYAGQNPPPNSGSGFNPPISPYIPTNVLVPRVGHIVMKNASGRWMDDNQGDWTEFVSGTNAAMSGRVEGWDLPDHDLAIIDTTTLEVGYATGLMNLCMALAVNPVSGVIAVAGTDGTNQRRFEPNLRGRFLRVNLAWVNPRTLEKTILDLNPHLDYATGNAASAIRDQSLGDPRGLIWNSNGTRLYVTGMGSRNLLVLDAGGRRLYESPIEVGEGPTGMVLDEARARLYVLNRFSATLSVLDTGTMLVVTNVSFFDPSPAAIKSGREHFYDTRRNSGLGHVSCASCHPDGRMDRLAWDLGDPTGKELLRTNVMGNSPERDFTYHPMKGPMVTQTLQDIIRHEPFHWRGDRGGIEDFNQTFPNLLGRDDELTAEQMREFKEFLATIHFPPNRYRNFDDTLSTNVPLGGLNQDLPEQENPALYGNAVIGQERFSNTGDTTCLQCHVPPSGTGFESTFPIFPPGPNGERHVLLIGDFSNSTPFKPPQLRNMADKIGMTLSRTNSRAGFGFTHDGRVDTLGRFLGSGGFHTINGDENIIAFLLSFSTPIDDEAVLFFAVPSRDVAASVGRQLTVTNSVESPFLREMVDVADSASNRADLVVRGVKDGVHRGWVYDRLMDEFRSDRHGEAMALPDLLLLASPTNELTFTVVPRGTGRRIGVDRDDDGYFDLSELDVGDDPLDPASHRSNTPPRLEVPGAMAIHNNELLSVVLRAVDDESAPAALTFRLGPNRPSGAFINPTNGHFSWTPSREQGGTKYRIGIQVIDDGTPPLTDEGELVVAVVDETVPYPALRFELPISNPPVIIVETAPGRSYRLQYKERLDATEWIDLYVLLATRPEMRFFDFTLSQGTPQRFYRVELILE